MDYSDDDESDGNKSKADNSFEPVMSSGEESRSSSEELFKPKPDPRKRNEFVFLDLTCDEIIETEDHESPDASTEELEKVCEQFLKSLQTETCVQTPAPTKKTLPSKTSKRKLFTLNYDEQIPVEEIKTPVSLPNNNKVIQLKTPIPSYLIPPLSRDKLKTTTQVITEPITPTNVQRSTNSKKNKTPRTPASSQVCGFLESLDGK